jgi:hypothetical protein
MTDDTLPKPPAASNNPVLPEPEPIFEPSPVQGAETDSLPVARADSDRPVEQSIEPALVRELRSWMFALCGWFVPGLGHALQKMWGRALVIFGAVGVLVFAGASLRGNVFASRGVDAFDKLGYLADMGSGIFYFIARAIERTGADVSHAQGDYGTRFIATAGILNLLAALHAYEAARGRKA